MNTIGTKIRIAREQAKLSQRELSDLCGWGYQQSRIGNYERDARQPSLNDIQVLAKALGKTVGYFFDETPDKEGLIKDVSLMRQAIEMIIEVEQEEGCAFTPNQKARMAVALYNDAVRKGKRAPDVTRQDLTPLLEAVN